MKTLVVTAPPPGRFKVSILDLDNWVRLSTLPELWYGVTLAHTQGMWTHLHPTGRCV